MTRELTSICAFCGHEHDRISQVELKGHAEKEEARAKPGDVTMCIHCGLMNVFDRDGMLRKPTAKEAKELAADPRILHMQEAWTAAMARRQ